MLKFPVRPWISSQIRPSDVILGQIFRREMLRRMRQGVPYKEAKFQTEDWYNEDALRAKYNLPKESVKVTLNQKDWTQYVKLNSFRVTRAEALKFLKMNMVVKEVLTAGGESI